MVTVAGMALGAIVFFISHRLNGPGGAWLSLVLFVLSPTALAHGGLATSDLITALGFTASVACIWRAWHALTPTLLASGSLAIAGLVLAKFSGLLIVPVLLAMLAVRLLCGPSWTIAIWKLRATLESRRAMFIAAGMLSLVQIGLILLLIWASYGFRYSAVADAQDYGRFRLPWQTVLSRDAAERTFTDRVVALTASWRLLPEAYLYGLAFIDRATDSRSAFLSGEYRSTGWRAFFPYAFAIKSTIPFMLLVTMGLGFGLCVTRRKTYCWVYSSSPWIVLICIYGAFAVSSNINIGHRYLLPLYPAMIIIAGALALPQSAVAGKTTLHLRVGATVLLLGWHATEALLTRGNYLSYFNQLVGGSRNGYRHLVDSSLDWGQDLPALKQWLDQRSLSEGPGEPVYLSYFGTAPPEFYGIRAQPLESYFETRRPGTPLALRPGWYCISATMLQGVYLAEGGPWTQAREQEYQRIKPYADLYLSSEDSSRAAALRQIAQATGPDFWPRLLAQFDRLRTARLMAYLRSKPPTDMAGHSILIYRLSAEDLEEALTGEAPRS